MKNIFFLITIIFLVITMSACSDRSNSTAVTLTASSTATQSSASGQYATPPAFVEHPDTAKIEYPDVTICYNDGKYIYSYNPRTQVKKQLVKGYNIYLSHDKTKFIFHAQGKKDGDYFLTNVYLYNIAKQETKLIYDNSNNYINSQYWFNNANQWSPDDRYVMLEQDNEVPAYAVSVIDTNTAKEITNLGVHDGQYWISDKEIIFNLLDISVEPPRPHTTGTPTSIAIYNVETGKQNILKQATSTDDYFCMVNEQNQIILIKYVYELISEPEKTYLGQLQDRLSYIIDKNGNILQKISDPYSTNSTYKENIAALKDMLPEPYRHYSYIQEPIHINNNWIILILDNNYQYREFFIMDKTNPHSLRKIDDGASISW